jgi:hypothetical protein
MLQELESEEMKGICISKNKYVNPLHQIIIADSEDNFVTNLET